MPLVVGEAENGPVRILGVPDRRAAGVAGDFHAPAVGVTERRAAENLRSCAVSLNNLALFIPFLSYLFGNPELWKQVAGVIGGLKH